MAWQDLHKETFLEAGIPFHKPHGIDPEARHKYKGNMWWANLPHRAQSVLCYVDRKFPLQDDGLEESIDLYPVCISCSCDMLGLGEPVRVA
eukprot:11032279-Alexandrium_andersonii.AAC.1